MSTEPYRLSEPDEYEECDGCDTEEPVRGVLVEDLFGGYSPYVYVCSNCEAHADDLVNNKAEKMYEASLADYYGGTGPTQEESYQAAAAEKRRVG
jgi:hypothetical protein